MAGQVFQIVLFWFVAFLSGSIPTAYIAGKLSRGIDIRSFGSGNVGATNAFRVFGKKVGAIVFIVDFLKGFLPVFILPLFLPAKNLDVHEAGLWVGTGCILGHVFSPFLGLKGGKGIATGGGVLCGSFPFIFLFVIGSWVIVFIITRIVSISSLVALLVLIVTSIVFGLKTPVIVLISIIVLFLVWTHRSNISRLTQGKESKIVSKHNI